MLDIPDATTVSKLMDQCFKSLNSYEEYISYILYNNNVYGLCPRYALVLSSLPDKALNVKQLGQCAEVYLNNLTYCVKKLQDCGYIKPLDEKGNDSRTRYYRITAEGKHVAKMVKEAQAEFVGNLQTKGFDYKDLAQSMTSMQHSWNHLRHSYTPSI